MRGTAWIAKRAGIWCRLLVRLQHDATACFPLARLETVEASLPMQQAPLLPMQMGQRTPRPTSQAHGFGRQTSVASNSLHHCHSQDLHVWGICCPSAAWSSRQGGTHGSGSKGWPGGRSMEARHARATRLRSARPALTMTTTQQEKVVQACKGQQTRGVESRAGHCTHYAPHSHDFIALHNRTNTMQRPT